MWDLVRQHACSSARAPDIGAAGRKQGKHDENPNEVRSMLIKVGLKKKYDRDEGSDHNPDQQVADERHKPHCDDEAPIGLKTGSSSESSSQQVVQMRREILQRKKHIIQKQVRKKVPELWPKTSRRERRALGVLITSAREAPTGRSVLHVCVEKCPLTMRHTAKAAAAAERAGVPISALLKIEMTQLRGKHPEAEAEQHARIHAQADHQSTGRLREPLDALHAEGGGATTQLGAGQSTRPRAARGGASQT